MNEEVLCLKISLRKNQLAINYTLKNEYYNLTLYFENDKIINYDFVQNSLLLRVMLLEPSSYILLMAGKH